MSMDKITNKEFSDFVKSLTKPEMSIDEIAKHLAISRQNLRYYVRIKAALDPDGECRNDFATWMNSKK